MTGNPECIFSSMLEEREKPELLAESPTRRKRIAQESGKTEQQVHPVLFSIVLTIVEYYV